MGLAGFKTHDGTDWKWFNPLDGNVSDTQTLKDVLVDLFYPIGSIYLSVKSTNPSTYLGGTWVLQSKGRTLVGVDTTDDDFKTVKKTGGSKTVTLTEAQMPKHNHGEKELYGEFSIGGWVARASHDADYISGVSGICSKIAYTTDVQYVDSNGNDTSRTYIDTVGITATHTHNDVGSGNAHTNLQPYFTVYIWERTS